MIHTMHVSNLPNNVELENCLGGRKLSVEEATHEGEWPDASLLGGRRSVCDIGLFFNDFKMVGSASVEICKEPWTAIIH